MPSGHPGPWNSSAAAVLSYDIPHRAPWDFRVSLYTFTKSISAGAYLVPLLLGALGVLPFTTALWGTQAVMVAMFALMLTGALLIWDLEHPERFWMVLLKPQWRSWLVRGGFVITGYGGLLAAHLGATWMGRADVTPLFGWIGGPLAAMTAVYTAYLFAQARARDLWQSPLLPAHLLVQALLAGAGVLMLIVSDPSLSQPITVLFRLSLAGHLVMVLGEALAQGSVQRVLSEGTRTPAFALSRFLIGGGFQLADEVDEYLDSIQDEGASTFRMDLGEIRRREIERKR